MKNPYIRDFLHGNLCLHPNFREAVRMEIYMMKKWICMFLAVLMLMNLSACGSEEEPTGRKIQLYYVSNDETNIVVRDYYLQAVEERGCVEEILGALRTVPEKLEYKAPLTLSFSVLGYTLDNGTLNLDLDKKYLELVPTTEVLVRAALVSSFTQIMEINYVSITVEGEPLYDNLGNLVGVMSQELFVNNLGSEISAYDTVDLTLYFANETGDQLIAVKRKKPYNTNIALDKLVVDELIAGPTETLEGIYPTINPDTKSISVTTKDGICYVNLDKTFLNQTNNVTAHVTIYSIVNSLAELSNVNKVQISIDGDTSGTYQELYSFSTIFERNLDMVTTLD